MQQKYHWNVRPRMTNEEYMPLKQFKALLAKLLFVRGIKTEKEGLDFIKTSGSKYNPFLMKNMVNVVHELLSAAEGKKKIVVYGDYDADGVTASAILIKALRSLGAEVSSYIPDRFDEGYGINKNALEKIKNEKADLVISVDCGIRSVEEAVFAKEIGLPLIITDHHEPGEDLPDALYVVAPKQKGDNYPEKNLAGCGIAYKIAEAISVSRGGNVPFDLDELTMIAAIGTVADVVPLTDENRSIVKLGLSLFRRKKCVFVSAMAEKAGFDAYDISSGLVAFTIAPRLNAAGRMDNAKNALELLLSENEEDAKKYADKIEKLNRERQNITQNVQSEAEKQIVEKGVPPVICMKDPSFSMGVVGLAAAKLTEKYYRPAFVGHTDGNEVRISGRSIEEFNMIEAMDAIPEVFVKYGGHAMAAGATVKEDYWDKFVEKINKKAEEMLDFNKLVPSISMDMVIPAHVVNINMLDAIAFLEPFGANNPQPVFEIDELKVIAHACVGSDKKHLKLKLLGNNNIPLDAIAFWAADREAELGEYIDIACSVEKNTWHGNDSVQLRIIDMRTSEIKTGGIS